MVKVACAVWPLALGGAAEAARHAGAGTEAAPASAEMATTDGGAGRALPPSAAPHSSQYCASSAFSVRHLSQVFMAFALRLLSGTLLLARCGRAPATPLNRRRAVHCNAKQ